MIRLRRRGRRPAPDSGLPVLVCSSGGVGNCGDDAILLRSVERIAAAAPGAPIHVLTDQDHPVPRLGSGRRLGVMQDWERVDIGGYRLVVVAGGGFACDWFGAHVAPRRAIAERAQAAGVPVLVTGQGVGPLTEPAVVADLRALAVIAGGIAVRDPRSLEVLERHGIAGVLTGDDALGLRPAGAPALPARYVAIHLRNAPYQTTDPSVLDAWARAVTEYASRHECDVVGIAVNDRAEAPERETLRAAGIEHVIDATNDPALLAAITRDAMTVVAHSYHVALFALAAGTPAVLSSAGPYYAAKAEGLRALAGLTDTVHTPEPPTASELRDRIDDTTAALRGNDALAQAATRVDRYFNERWARR